MRLFGLFFLILVPVLFSGCGGGDPSGNASGSVSGVSKFAASQPCMSASCHAGAISPGTGALIPNEWLASTHNTRNGAGCADCHEPDSGHPTLCSKCHGGGSGAVTKNPDQAGKCGKCHGLAFPNDIMMALSPKHFGNMTASINNNNYRASYVSSNYVGNCRKCHNPHDPSTAHDINADWAGSGHGNVLTARTNYDFKTRGSYQPFNLTFEYYCVRCHTSTGFIKFVNSGFLDVKPFAGPGYPVVQNAPVKVAPGSLQPADKPSPDKTKEVTGCDVCHDDGRGYAYGWKVRAVPPVTIYYNFSSSNSSPTIKLNNNPVHYPDAGESNECITCHTGRGIGSMIYAASVLGMDFTNTNGPSSHDRAAGLDVFQTGGYEFVGRSYASPTFLHRNIGIGNFRGTGYRGPCVSCHMSSGRSHTFLPVTLQGTTVTAIISTTCGSCHNGTTAPVQSVTWINTQKSGFKSALAILSKLRTGKVVSLPNRNSNYDAPYPGGGANTMGVTFNYGLLANDTGAYAHNPLYTKRLIWDSIDWIYNGVLDNDVIAAINSVPVGGTITADTKAAAINYLSTAEDGVTPLSGRP